MTVAPEFLNCEIGYLPFSFIEGNTVYAPGPIYSEINPTWHILVGYHEIIIQFGPKTVFGLAEGTSKIIFTGT